MNRIIVGMIVLLSMTLGGCGGYVTHRTTVVGTVPAHHHHEESVRDQVVTRTTTVEAERHNGTVVKKTTVIVRKRAVDCSDRNPYRDEHSPSSPCYWKKHVH